MTYRHTADSITDDALDRLYARAEAAERTEAELQRLRRIQQLPERVGFYLTSYDEFQIAEICAGFETVYENVKEITQGAEDKLAISPCSPQAATLREIVNDLWRALNFPGKVRAADREHTA